MRGESEVGRGREISGGRVFSGDRGGHVGVKDGGNGVDGSGKRLERKTFRKRTSSGTRVGGSLKRVTEVFVRERWGLEENIPRNGMFSMRVSVLTPGWQCALGGGTMRRPAK